MGLYALMLVLPVIGIVAYVWHGRVFDFGLFRFDFGVASQKGVYEPAEEIHQALAYVLMGLVGLHVAGALWHHFVARDGIFARILPIRQ
jgi:cytochrome b561